MKQRDNKATTVIELRVELSLADAALLQKAVAVQSWPPPLSPSPELCAPGSAWHKVWDALREALLP